MAGDAFDEVRADDDPIRQARHATELMTLYQQRGVELARLRKEAINRAVQERGLSYTEVAREVGLSKGRITQIRQTAPPAERGIFGVGPVTVAVPVRASERPGGVVAVEDAAAAERMTELLMSLAFTVEQYRIPPDGNWVPPLDAVAICGPKSSRVTSDLISSDPHLSFDKSESGNWAIRINDTHEMLNSPIDAGEAGTDVAYISRRPYKDGSILVIAGVHALGSLMAVQFLQDHLAELYKQVGTQMFSMVVQGTARGTDVTRTEAVWGPRLS